MQRMLKSPQLPGLVGSIEVAPWELLCFSSLQVPPVWVCVCQVEERAQEN